MDGNTPMRHGKYKGVPLKGVPAKHLLWLLEENLASIDLKQYILDNLENIKTKANGSNLQNNK